MHVAIMIDRRMFRAQTKPGHTLLCGRCPQCLAVLELHVPHADGDAVCLACGGVVGRIVVDAIVTARGTVVPHAA